LSFSVPEPTAGKAGLPQPARRRAWAYVGLMMLCILLTLPAAPIFWRAALKMFGPSVNAVGYVVFLLVFVGFLIYITRRRRSSTCFF